MSYFHHIYFLISNFHLSKYSISSSFSLHFLNCHNLRFFPFFHCTLSLFCSPIRYPHRLFLSKFKEIAWHELLPIVASHIRLHPKAELRHGQHDLQCHSTGIVSFASSWAILTVFLSVLAIPETSFKKALLSLFKTCRFTI